MTSAADKGIRINAHSSLIRLQKLIQVFDSVFLPRFQTDPLIRQFLAVDLFQQFRDPCKNTVSAGDAGLFPDLGILVGVRFDLGAVNVGVVQIHVFFQDTRFP